MILVNLSDGLINPCINESMFFPKALCPQPKSFNIYNFLFFLLFDFFFGGGER